MRHDVTHILLLSISISICWASVAYAAAQSSPLNNNNIDIPVLDEELEFDEDVEDVPIEQIRNFIETFQVIKDNYVEGVSNNVLFENAMYGLAEHLDPYSRYLDAEHYQQLLEFTEGQIAEPQFKLIFKPEQQQWQLSNIVANSDNYRKGLRNGQVVERINSTPIQTLNERSLNSLLSGALGSALSLRVRIDNKLRNIEVIRDQPQDYNVEPFLTDERILVLRIKAFQQETSPQVQEAIKVYQQRTNNIRGILIDLRDNPGGLLSSAVDLADLFLEQGLIVTTKGRIDAPQKFQAFPSHSAFEYPIAILQNRFSASAAEVFSAALKEHKRAVVIGENSYGKGAIQKLFPLTQGALQLTVAYYYTPSGQLIEGKGVAPNTLLNMNTAQTEQQVLQQALSVFEKTLAP